jgi:hypothetical protein
VTFTYKTDPARETQYGLIAEDVAQVYPDLVVRDQDGQVQTVQYHKLVPMLLNEMQKQRRRDEEEVAQLRARLEAQSDAIAALTARLSRFEASAASAGSVASR